MTTAEVATTSWGSFDCDSRRTVSAMSASPSIRSFSRDTIDCFEPMLSYTVCAETPAARAMSRTLVRL